MLALPRVEIGQRVQADDRYHLATMIEGASYTPSHARVLGVVF
jgi:hypothetical protein